MPINFLKVPNGNATLPSYKRLNDPMQYRRVTRSQGVAIDIKMRSKENIKITV